MKKTITVIMALVLAATALCGCNDEDQSGAFVSIEKFDVSITAEDLNDDTEVVKQLALQELNAIKKDDIDKYLELSNINNISAESYIEEDLVNYTRETIKACFCEIQDLNWFLTDISDFEVTEFIPSDQDNSNWATSNTYIINWNDGYCSLKFRVFMNAKGEYTAFIENVYLGKDTTS